MEERKKSIGNVVNLQCELTTPMKLTLDSMDLKSVNILCGKNGSGKTMINKIVFFSTFATLIDLTEKNQPNVIEMFFKSLDVNNTLELVQFVFDNTFVDPKEINAHLIVNFENGTFECDIINGEVNDLKMSYDQGVTEGSYPRYMSTSTRLFSQMESILLIQKTLGDKEVLKHCQLYDLMHCNTMMNFALQVSDVRKEVREILKENYDCDIVSLHYDEENSKFFLIDSESKKKMLSSFSAGHQSIINMFITVNI